MSTTTKRVACRFCHHPVRAHDGIEGCPHCRCAATQGEAVPRTRAEMDRAAITEHETLPEFRGDAKDEVHQSVVDGAQRAYELGVAFGQELRARIEQKAAEAPEDETVAQMADPEHYASLAPAVLPLAERHPCPVEDCRLSAEEHHRLAFGMIAENTRLRHRVAELEHGKTSGDTDADETLRRIAALIEERH